MEGMPEGYKEVRHQNVAVSGFTADNGKHIMVSVCTGPDEAHASKDQKHLCFIREAKLVLPDKDPQPISENEEKMILRSFFALRGVITNLFETKP